MVGGTLRFLADVVTSPPEFEEEPATAAVQRLSKKPSPSEQQKKQVKQAGPVKHQAKASESSQESPSADGQAQASVK
ncbi:hypothetical protein GCM10011572_50520 [Pseudoduganella buxea]|uniref:Uncharacterized protein n=1 Tax=Pseudoduganella buxea TaxID=1949069 RepID=A0ABQ1LCG4_9BURK|nr:hypothetical protein GCM10011572_50520 [Pseudoduganella buxea]